MKKVAFVLLGVLCLLSACQPTDSSLDTAASTSWGADLGSKVWLDRNQNGQKELYEPGIAGVSVTLWLDQDNNGVADTVQDTMQTDSKGQYRFNALDPNLSYFLEVVAPSGYLFSPKRVTGESESDFDSDINASGFSDRLNLQKGVYNYMVDAALFEAVSSVPSGNTRIGSRVWLDKNADGIKQASEPGFANVTLNLWWDKDKNGSPDQKLKTLLSDKDGFYRFEGLDGLQQYLLEVKAPVGYTFSPKNNPAAPGADWDSDINPETGFSDLLSLVPNTLNYTYDVGLRGLNQDPTNWTKAVPGRVMALDKKGTGMLGVSYSKTGSDYTYQLVQLDKLGNEIWTSPFGAVSTFPPSKVVLRQAANGDIYVLSVFEFLSSGFAAYLHRFDANGLELMSMNLDLTGYLEFADFLISNNDLLLTAYSHEASATRSGVYLLQLSKEGQKLAETFYPEFRNKGIVMDMAQDGNMIYILGTQYLLAVDSAFAKQWVYQPNLGQARWYRLGYDGNFYIAGYDTSGIISLRKLDKTRNPVFETSYPMGGYSYLSTLELDGSGIYLAGYTSGTLPGFTKQGGADAFVLAFDQTGKANPLYQLGTSYEDRVNELLLDSSGLYLAYDLGAEGYLARLPR